MTEVLITFAVIVIAVVGIALMLAIPGWLEDSLGRLLNRMFS